jgi:hypothetical protein
MATPRKEPKEPFFRATVFVNGGRTGGGRIVDITFYPDMTLRAVTAQVVRIFEAAKGGPVALRINGVGEPDDSIKAEALFSKSFAIHIHVKQDSVVCEDGKTIEFVL